mgnify:CR=1 FL=1
MAESQPRIVSVIEAGFTLRAHPVGIPDLVVGTGLSQGMLPPRSSRSEQHAGVAQMVAYT